MFASSLFELAEIEPPARVAEDRDALDGETLDFLRDGVILGSEGEYVLSLPQTDPAVYARAKPILLNLGFTWHKRRKVHLGNNSAVVAFEEAIETGMYFDSRKRLEYFPTAIRVAGEIAKEAAAHLWQDEPVILEPSAGDGVFVQALLDAVPHGRITAVEMDELRVRLLQRRFGSNPRVRIVKGDILAFHKGPWDAIVLNPPFDHALEHLRHLNTIARPGCFINGIVSLDRPCDAELRQWLHDRDSCWSENERDLFQTTTVAARRFEFRVGPSLYDELTESLLPHHSLTQTQIRRLTELSRDAHIVFEANCNGDIATDEEYENLVTDIEAEAALYLRPEGISLEFAWDPRAGHGFRLALPSCQTNDFGQSGMIVPPALRLEPRGAAAW